MIEHAEYAVTVRSTGEKMGVAESPESGLPPVTVAPPPEFDGPGGAWSPEHLFVASVASCFMTTFTAIAGFSRLDVLGIEVPGVGTIERGEDRRYRFTDVVLRPRIVLAGASERERAERIAQKAEEACLVTRSLGTRVAVEPRIEIGSAAPAPVH